MKILILGGTGMAGHTISVYLKEAGYDVIAFSRKKIDYCQNINGDVTDFQTLKKILIEGEFDAVVNAVGILNQEAEEDKSSAVLINSYLPHFLSEVTKEMKTKIIHMSTDCVFSGKEGNYSEDSFRNGESFYDRSKALGEIENNKDLTFRTSIIGPDMSENGIGLFNWFVKQNEVIKGYTGAIWTGVTTIVLAKAIDQVLKENTTGIYNLVNNKTITKYELVKLFNKYMKNDELVILPYDKVSVDKSLVNNREDFSFSVPSYEAMIIEMKDWIVRHKEFYPHYFK